MQSKKRKQRDEALDSGSRRLFKGTRTQTPMRPPDSKQLWKTGKDSVMPDRPGDLLSKRDVKSKMLDSIPTALFRQGANVDFKRKPEMQGAGSYETQESQVLSAPVDYVSNPKFRKLTSYALGRINYGPLIKRWQERASALDQQPLLSVGDRWKTSDSAQGAPFAPFQDGGTDTRSNQLALFSAAKSGFARNKALSVLRTVARPAPTNTGFKQPMRLPSYGEALKQAIANTTGLSVTTVDKATYWADRLVTSSSDAASTVGMAVGGTVAQVGRLTYNFWQLFSSLPPGGEESALIAKGVPPEYQQAAAQALELVRSGGVPAPAPSSQEAEQKKRMDDASTLPPPTATMDSLQPMPDTAMAPPASDERESPSAPKGRHTDGHLRADRAPTPSPLPPAPTPETKDIHIAIPTSIIASLGDSQLEELAAVLDRIHVRLDPLDTAPLGHIPPLQAIREFDRSFGDNVLKEMSSETRALQQSPEGRSALYDVMWFLAHSAELTARGIGRGAGGLLTAMGSGVGKLGDAFGAGVEAAVAAGDAWGDVVIDVMAAAAPVAGVIGENAAAAAQSVGAQSAREIQALGGGIKDAVGAWASGYIQAVGGAARAISDTAGGIAGVAGSMQLSDPERVQADRLEDIRLSRLWVEDYKRGAALAIDQGIQPINPEGNPHIGASKTQTVPVSVEGWVNFEKRDGTFAEQLASQAMIGHSDPPKRTAQFRHSAEYQPFTPALGVVSSALIHVSRKYVTEATESAIVENQPAKYDLNSSDRLTLLARQEAAIMASLSPDLSEASRKAVTGAIVDLDNAVSRVATRREFPAPEAGRSYPAMSAFGEMVSVRDVLRIARGAGYDDAALDAIGRTLVDVGSFVEVSSKASTSLFNLSDDEEIETHVYVPAPQVLGDLLNTQIRARVDGVKVSSLTRSLTEGLALVPGVDLSSVSTRDSPDRGLFKLARVPTAYDKQRTYSPARLVGGAPQAFARAFSRGDYGVNDFDAFRRVAYQGVLRHRVK